MRELPPRLVGEEIVVAGFDRPMVRYSWPEGSRLALAHEYEFLCGIKEGLVTTLECGFRVRVVEFPVDDIGVFAVVEKHGLFPTLYWPLRLLLLRARRSARLTKSYIVHLLEVWGLSKVRLGVVPRWRDIKSVGWLAERLGYGT